MPQTPTDLQWAVAAVNENLQLIQALAGATDEPQAKISFPRGYIRTSAEARQLFLFVRKSVLQRNLSYSVQLADVFRWILSRTDLAGIARGMVVKSYIALAGSICEALLQDHFAGRVGKGQPFAARVRTLEKDGTASSALSAELTWLWTMRNRQHAFGVDESELESYAAADFGRARDAVNQLIRALAAVSGRTVRAPAV